MTKKRPGLTKAALLAWSASLLVFYGLMLALPAPVGAVAGQVGNGTPGSCTEAALSAALAASPGITFSCGGAATINITSEKVIDKDTTIEGAGLITLRGVGNTRLFKMTYQKSLTVRNSIIRDFSFSSTSDLGGVAIQGAWESNITIAGSKLLDNTFNNTAAGTYDKGGAVFVQGGTLTVDNSEFIGNKSYKSGGAALHTIGANAIIRNSFFSGNQSTAPGNGGAFYSDNVRGDDGFIVVQDSTFTGNTAQDEGGAVRNNMYLKNQNALYERVNFINNSVTSGPAGASGGAVRIGDGRFTFRNTLFSGNSSQGQGGAIWTGETVFLDVINSAIVSNSATAPSGTSGMGGGIAVNSSASSVFNIINTTISNNTTGFMGGGMALNTEGAFNITNSTIADNYAWWQGGGIQNARENVILKNSIIANNTANNGGNPWNVYHNCFPGGGGKYTSGGYNLQYSALNSNSSEDCAPGISLKSDPKLAALANNGGFAVSRALLGGSPAINAVPAPNCTVTTDGRGIARPLGGACDIGAFEVAPPPTISVAFGPAFQSGGTTSLIFTLSSPSAANLSGLSFSNTLPGQLKIAPNPALSSTCGGPVSVTAVPGSSIVTVSGVSVAGNQSCTISVQITSSQPGTYSNTTGPVSAVETGPGAVSNAASVTVKPLPPTIALAFNPAVINLNNAPSNTVSNLTFVLANPNAITLADLAFSHQLPPQLTLSAAASNPCGGSLTTTPASRTISFVGGSLGANLSCTFSVPVTGNAAGVWATTTGAISASGTNPGLTASASVKVVVPFYQPLSLNSANLFRLGAVKPNATRTASLSLANTSHPITELNVSVPTLSGPNAARFSLVNAGDFPRFIGGGSSHPLTLACTPLALGTITATVSLSTNHLGQPNTPSSFTASCTGGYVVSVSLDNGAPGTLSHVLANQAVNSGDGVVFETGITDISFSGPTLLKLKPGVTLDGGCNSGPGVTIDGTGAGGSGLLLEGNNYIAGLIIKNFPGPQLLAGPNGGNQTACVVTRKN